MTSRSNNAKHPFNYLELVPGLCAMPVAWRDHFGPYYEGFRACYLRQNPAITGVILPDTVPLHFSWADFGQSLALALGCATKIYETGLPGMWQIGAWSTESVPVFLCISPDTPTFRLAVAGIVARLRQRFILFAPTSSHFDAFAQEMLNRDGSAFFDLETH